MEAIGSEIAWRHAQMRRPVELSALQRSAGFRIGSLFYTRFAHDPYGVGYRQCDRNRRAVTKV